MKFCLEKESKLNQVDMHFHQQIIKKEHKL
jgi:hypothetical protein